METESKVTAPGNAPEIFTSKIGTNKGVPRSRVWIEGRRLAEAGFTVGALYGRVSYQTSLTLLLKTAADQREGVQWFKVSGKGDKPIIDITGKLVTETFRGEKVEVTFEPGVITIRETATPYEK